jgi:hypothetical protein
MYKIRPLIFTLFIVVFFSMTSSALACACCADRGTYSIWTSTVADYQNELLKDMKFGKKAEFYQTPADFDETHGLGELIQEWQTGVYADPDLVDAYINNVWRFDFRSAGGKTGSLLLPRPLKMTSRRIDIPDNTSKAPDITLYKEFIFTGTVRSGTGFFKSGIVRPTTFTLLFQGRGNNCDNADDFTNWHLEVKGRRADYTFFGKMAVAEKDALDTPQ